MSCSSVDGLKIGDKVLFRLHERHYLNGRLTLMAIPYADNPNKEVEFSTQFVPDVALSQLTRPKDNVKGLAIRSSCHRSRPAMTVSVKAFASLWLPDYRAHLRKLQELS